VGGCVGFGGGWLFLVLGEVRVGCGGWSGDCLFGSAEMLGFGRSAEVGLVGG